MLAEERISERLLVDLELLALGLTFARFVPAPRLLQLSARCCIASSCQPLRAVCWLHAIDKCASSGSHEVRNVWGAYHGFQRAVLVEVRGDMAADDDDGAWVACSSAAEQGLLRAYVRCRGLLST